MSAETLWAIDLGEDKYRIDNCPFFAYSISCGDVVYAPKDQSSGAPTFISIVRKSGNKTLRIFFDTPLRPGNFVEEILHSLNEKGCGYEGYSDRYFSINIPSTVQYYTICEYLLSKKIQWEDADR